MISGSFLISLRLTERPSEGGARSQTVHTLAAQVRRGGQQGFRGQEENSPEKLRLQVTLFLSFFCRSIAQIAITRMMANRNTEPPSGLDSGQNSPRLLISLDTWQNKFPLHKAPSSQASRNSHDFLRNVGSFQQNKQIDQSVTKGTGK